MIKVNILTRCEHCEGDCYVPVGEAESYSGERYIRYEPCSECDGVGRQTKWIGLSELADLMERAVSFETDWQELAQQKPVSQYQDSRDAAGI